MTNSFIFELFKIKKKLIKLLLTLVWSPVQENKKSFFLWILISNTRHSYRLCALQGEQPHVHWNNCWLGFPADSASPANMRAISPKEPSIYYVHKIFRKTNISNPLIRTRNSSFSEKFAYVLNAWHLTSRWKRDLDATFNTYARWEYLT